MQALDLRVEDVAEDDSFIGFKHAVIAYLSDFLVALDEYQPDSSSRSGGPRTLRC